MRPKLTETAPVRLSFTRRSTEQEKSSIKRSECSKCKGQSTSYRRDDMIWRKCLSCDNTWCMGGSMLLASATGEDRQEIMRDLLREPDFIQVSPETKRSVLSWEQDNETMNRNTELYKFSRFIDEDY